MLFEKFLTPSKIADFTDSPILLKQTVQSSEQVKYICRIILCCSNLSRQLNKILAQIRKQHLPPETACPTRLCHALPLLTYSSYCSWEINGSLLETGWTISYLEAYFKIGKHLLHYRLVCSPLITVSNVRWLCRSIVIAPRMCCVKQIQMFSIKLWSRLGFVCYIFILLHALTSSLKVLLIAFSNLWLSSFTRHWKCSIEVRCPTIRDIIRDFLNLIRR